MGLESRLRVQMNNNYVYRQSIRHDWSRTTKINDGTKILNNQAIYIWR